MAREHSAALLHGRVLDFLPGPRYGSEPGYTPRQCALPGPPRGMRIRCRCSRRAASRWASASDGLGSRTSSANSACPLSREERLAEIRDTVAALRQLDGPDLHTPVVMAVRGPKGRALAAELADTVTFVAMPDDPGVEIAKLARDFRALRDVELALHVPVVGDEVAPFMTSPDTDPVALRAIDSLAVLPADPAAATEEIQRRREEIGFSYFVVGAGSADTLAPVVAALAGQ